MIRREFSTKVKAAVAQASVRKSMKDTMTSEARRAYWVHYRNASNAIPEIRARLTELEGDLDAMRRAMDGEPSMVENGFPYIVNRLDELAAYAREIKTAIEAKQQDGKEAEARIDVLIGAAQ